MVRLTAGLLFSLALGAAALVGCNSTEPPAATPNSGTDAEGQHEHSEESDHAHSEDAEHHEHGDHEHGSGGDSAEIEAAMAKLSPEDRALAERQKTCPVSGDPLGSMGTPIKVTVEGRDVFVCCKGCIKQVKEHPEKYLPPSKS